MTPYLAVIMQPAVLQGVHMTSQPAMMPSNAGCQRCNNNTGVAGQRITDKLEEHAISHRLCFVSWMICERCSLTNVHLRVASHCVLAKMASHYDNVQTRGTQQHRHVACNHLKDREWAQMGVNRMAGTLGCTMDPPAATE